MFHNIQKRLDVIRMCVCKRFQNAMIGCRADISYFDMQEILLYSGFENTPVKSGTSGGIFCRIVCCFSLSQ